MKQYSADPGERLVEAIDAGLPQAEAALLFGVCRAGFAIAAMRLQRNS
jgi:hypothetical protein